VRSSGASEGGKNITSEGCGKASAKKGIWKRLTSIKKRRQLGMEDIGTRPEQGSEKELLFKKHTWYLGHHRSNREVTSELVSEGWPGIKRRRVSGCDFAQSVWGMRSMAVVRRW